MLFSWLVAIDRGSEEAEEASPQVDELMDAKQFATTMGVGIGGVIV